MNSRKYFFMYNSIPNSYGCCYLKVCSIVQVSDTDILKEAKPGFYKKHILPILHRNGVVHFVGFGNRLASDPIPFKVQVN